MFTLTLLFKRSNKTKHYLQVGKIIILQIEAAGTCQTTTSAVVYHKILGMISLAMELLNQLPNKENLYKIGIIHSVSLHLQPKRRNTGKMRDLLVQVPTIVLLPMADLWGLEVMIQGTRI
jgi:hypothetical protein